MSKTFIGPAWLAEHLNEARRVTLHDRLFETGQEQRSKLLLKMSKDIGKMTVKVAEVRALAFKNPREIDKLENNAINAVEAARVAIVKLLIADAKRK